MRIGRRYNILDQFYVKKDVLSASDFMVTPVVKAAHLMIIGCVFSSPLLAIEYLQSV